MPQFASLIPARWFELLRLVSDGQLPSCSAMVVDTCLGFVGDHDRPPMLIVGRHHSDGPLMVGRHHAALHFVIARHWSLLRHQSASVVALVVISCCLAFFVDRHRCRWSASVGVFGLRWSALVVIGVGRCVEMVFCLRWKIEANGIWLSALEKMAEERVEREREREKIVPGGVG